MKISKFSREYSICSYECDAKGTLRIVSLMNMFQDAADTHAEMLGVGIEHCMKHGLAWFGSNYHIKIFRMPSWHEKMKISTWPSQEKKIGAVRDFEVVDENGNVIIVASSQWILIDFAKKRPLALRENLPDYEVVEERALDTAFPKIDLPENVTFRKNFAVRYDDIDVNGHVNNAVYPLWATEAVEKYFRLKNHPAEIEIAFKKETLYGDIVSVNTQINEKVSLHEMTAGDDNHEIARLRILWQEA